MRFEKWQALGNDYLIVEREELPFELTPARVRRLCEGHFGVFADGVLELSRAGGPGSTWPTCASSTPTARRPSCPATARARRSSTCAAAAGPTRTLHDPHRRRQIRPTITGPARARVDMGPARLRFADFPGGPPTDGRGTVDAGGRARGAFGTSRSATPSARSASTPRRSSQRSSSRAIGPPIEGDAQFPNRTNVSWYTELEPGRRPASARASSSAGVGETLSSGTGATGRRGRLSLAGIGSRRRGTRRSRVVLDGGELEVEVGRGPARQPDRLGATRVRGPPQRQTSIEGAG